MSIYLSKTSKNLEKSLPQSKKEMKKSAEKNSRNKKIQVHADSSSVGEHKDAKIFTRATRRVRDVESTAVVLLPGCSLGSEPVLPRERTEGFDKNLRFLTVGAGIPRF